METCGGGVRFGLGIAMWSPWRGSTRPIDQPSLHLDLDLDSEVSFGSTTGCAVILSQDGTRMVFVSQGVDGMLRLFTRSLDQPKAAQMPGTEGAYAILLPGWAVGRVLCARKTQEDADRWWRTCFVV